LSHLPVSSGLPLPLPRQPAASAPLPSVPPPETPALPTTSSVEAPEREPSPTMAGPAKEGEAPPTEPARLWREELSERVDNFRRRRARLRGDVDRSTNLELDFGGEEQAEAGTEIDAEVVEAASRQTRLDIELERPTRRGVEATGLDSLSLEGPEGGERAYASAAVDAAELPLEPGAVRRQPIEIVMDSQPAAEAGEIEAVLLPKAPLGRRFVAGTLDALVLLVAAGLFALIFWRAGGRLSPQPLELGVIGFITSLSIMAYFGVFTALTCTTPGLLWLGIEVRTLDGAYPTATQALWRAFGYLVSTSALMLGFAWALVDSDGLTWHDRMSGTFLALADGAPGSRAPTAAK
jgi:uncharacterized RDD family membrane protein YckC